MKCKFVRKSSLILLLAVGSFSSLGFAAANTLRVNGDGTVTDVVTGLLWQQAEDGVGRTHAEAIAHCMGLSLANKTNWRLPNVKEVTTIIDRRNAEPALKRQTFVLIGDPRAWIFWTSTQFAHDTDNAYSYGLRYGGWSTPPKTSTYKVLCVHSA